MKLPATAARLYEVLAHCPVIDCHEHLPPEKDQLSKPVDVFTLFSHYTRTDFLSAGMTLEDYQRMIDPEADLEDRWKRYSPYLKHVRHGSYARPAYIAARDLYGEEGICDENYRRLTDKMQAAHQPGIYEGFLGKCCGIETSLTQGGHPGDFKTTLFRVVSRPDYFTVVSDRPRLEENCRIMGIDPDCSLDEYAEAIVRFMDNSVAHGAVGFKTIARPFRKTTREEAAKRLAEIRNGETGDASWGDAALHTFLSETVCRVAGRLGVPLAVHAGMWGDFRDLDAAHWIPMFARFPETRFDLYHLSMPNTRDAIMIGKNFPNVWLNLCWCHIISQQWSVAAMHEILDLVPVNKILGFGGDYCRPYMKVYGHLHMARENAAAVLGARVDAGDFDEAEALRIARLWFYENPKSLYGL